MNGVLAQYNGQGGALTWSSSATGKACIRNSRAKNSASCSAGRHYVNRFYYGFNYSMFHFAGQKGAELENVVDLQLLNPCVGVKFNAFFDFDIKLGALAHGPARPQFRTFVGNALHG